MARISSAAHSLSHSSAPSGDRRRTTSCMSMESPGAGTSGITSWWSNPSSGTWKLAVMK